MTRGEEIHIAASKYVEENSINGYVAISDHKDSFIEGAQWADDNPKSLWISVKDDLPCNHDDMYNMTGSLIYTDDVLALAGNKPVIVCMMFNDNTGEWKWNKLLNIKYWMLLPEPPKQIKD